MGQIITQIPLPEFCHLHVSLPEGWVGLLRDRSSMAQKRIYIYSGVIDSSYRGEIMVILANAGAEDAAGRPYEAPLIARSAVRRARECDGREAATEPERELPTLHDEPTAGDRGEVRGELQPTSGSCSCGGSGACRIGFGATASREWRGLFAQPPNLCTSVRTRAERRSCSSPARYPLRAP